MFEFIMLYPIIIAGGQGTRLWPVSRKNNPKQIKPFLDGKTLLYKTFHRLLKLAPARHIFLSTNASIARQARKEVKGMPAKNIIVEPVRRDTAAALGLALFRLCKHDKSAIFVYINADNFVKNEKEYARVLKAGEKIIKKNPGKVLLVGIRPLYPETGYGYIKIGTKIKGEEKIFYVDEFVEKPPLAKAKKFLSSGKYLWNPTLIIARAEHFLNLYKKYLPETYDLLKKISEGPNETAATAELFPKINPVSIDYGILEKEKGMIVMPADFGWMDIGHWKAIWEMLYITGKDNVEIGKHVNIDSKQNLIYSENKKLVATIGLNDMLIVETDDALMICPKDRAQEVKALVKKMEEEGMEEYL